MDELLKFLGEKNTEKIKDAVTDMIINDFESMKDYDYLFDADAIQSQITEILSDVVESEKKHFEETIRLKFNKMMEELAESVEKNKNKGKMIK